MVGAAGTLPLGGGISGTIGALEPDAPPPLTTGITGALGTASTLPLGGGTNGTIGALEPDVPPPPLAAGIIGALGGVGAGTLPLGGGTNGTMGALEPDAPPLG